MLKKFATFIFSLVCASLINVSAQNCTIVSADYVCLDEPLALSVTINGGGTPTSYTWNLDGTSSTQATPGPTYSTPGVKNISVTVGLPGGGTCTATKQITVHDPPDVDFEILPTSSFCRDVGQVCIKDLTKPGVTGSSIVSVTPVWGDGDASSGTSAGQTYCHTYQFAGTYTITFEVRNDKGCTKKITKTVKIGSEFELKYDIDTLEEWCDSIAICFTNQNTLKYVGKPLAAGDASKIVWDFGDGEQDTLLANFQKTCHTYKKEGLFTHSLTVTNTDGCNQKYTHSIDTPYLDGNPICNVHFSKYDFTVTKNKDTGCWSDQVFTFLTENRKGAEYRWEAKKSPTGPYSVFGESSSGVLYPANFGATYIRLRVFRADCEKIFYDTVYVCGPRVNFTILNNKQCNSIDTVFFCDRSDYACVSNLFRIWDFDDPNAPQCTTDLANNINVGMNCNYSKDAATKHFYLDTGCYDPQLTLYDSVTMCYSKDSGLVEIGSVDVNKLTITNNLPCEGYKPEYVFFFDYGRPCYIPTVEINWDSACGKDNWEDFRTSHIYDFHCQDDDSVTIGLNMSFGDRKRFRSCDPGDFFYDDDAVCRDTLWYHNQFKLFTEPDIKITNYQMSDSCIPLTIKTILLDSFIPTAKYLQYRWRLDDPHYDTLTATDSIIRIPDQVIDTFGEHRVYVRVTDEMGCYDHDSTGKFLVGFNNHFYIHDPLRYSPSKPWLSRDTLFCVNDTVMFADSVKYFNSIPSDYPWRNPFGSEELHWDFGDGGGFTEIGTFPRHSYSAPGVYDVKLAAKDVNGCWDTVSFPVYISGVEAGIKKPIQNYLCDDIVQLFDSSVIKNNVQNDEVIDWWWNFGDFTNDNFVKDPFHSFTSNGNFIITHAVTTKFGCVDTVQSVIEILGPKPNFNIVSDTVGCVPFEVEFDNNSADIYEWIWNFGDQNNTIINTKSDTNVSFTYTQPGWYDITLFGTDSLYNPATGSYKYCSAQFPDTNVKPVAVRRVLVLGIPPADFNLPDEVCVDDVFNVSDQSDTIYELYKWTVLELPDSFSSNQKQVSYQFSDTGKYTLLYTPTYEPIPPYQRRCYDTTQKTITVKDVKADFIMDTMQSDMPYFFFNNRSSDNAVRFEWDFGHYDSDKNFSEQRDAGHDYKSDTGSFKVCLTAYNDIGCWDSVCKTVKNRYFVYVIIPNVFTPENGDGFNDAFDIDIFGEELYDLTIYNRWGETVFHGTEDGYGNDGINWDGESPSGIKYPAGTYYFIFKYRLRDMEQDEEISGVVTLIRPKL